MTSTEEPKRWLLTVDSSIVEGVGRVAIHFTHLDEEVAHLVWSLIAGRDVLDGTDAANNNLVAQQLGQAVTLNLGFRQKVGLLGNLFAERFSERLDLMKVLEVLKEALGEVAHWRNHLVHSVLAGNTSLDGSSTPGTAVAIKGARDKDKGMSRSVSIHSQEELGALADVIAQLSFQVHTLRQECFKAGGKDESPSRGEPR